MSGTRRWYGFAVGLILVASAASVVVPAGSAGAVTKTITGTSMRRWTPATLKVAHGVTIHWHAASLDHTVTAWGGNWTFNKTLNQGATVSRVFGTKGVFHFYCRIHGAIVNGKCVGMCGTITVT